MTGLVVTKHAHGGAVLRLTLDAPPGNILDIAMIRALRGAVDAHGGSLLGAIWGLPTVRDLLEPAETRRFVYGSIHGAAPHKRRVIVPLRDRHGSTSN